MINSRKARTLSASQSCPAFLPQQFQFMRKKNKQKESFIFILDRTTLRLRNKDLSFLWSRKASLIWVIFSTVHAAWIEQLNTQKGQTDSTETVFVLWAEGNISSLKAEAADFRASLKWTRWRWYWMLAICFFFVMFADDDMEEEGEGCWGLTKPWGYSPLLFALLKRNFGVKWWTWVKVLVFGSERWKRFFASGEMILALVLPPLRRIQNWTEQRHLFYKSRLTSCCAC